MNLTNTTAPTIDVLLATYNGAKYLDDQISSLFAQSYSDFRVIARDDGSSDETQEILNKYHQKYGDKFVVISDESPSGSAKANFARLTRQSDADYTMYCDQDDYWHPEKIRKTLAAMIEAEAGASSTPILVHTDLQVVDIDMNVISPSLWTYQGLNPKHTTVNNLAVQNNITGCTVMINRALREKAQPFPDGMIMHDWWLGLVAALKGKIVAINESTMDYRQHAANDTGAKDYSTKYVLDRAMRIFTASRLDEFKSSIERNKVQVKAFIASYGRSMSERQREQLESFVNLEKMGLLARRAFVLKNGFMKQGLARNIAYLLSL